jgi:hypothetical protein
MQYPVSTVDDTYDACHPEVPLKANDKRYVDLTTVRGNENFINNIVQSIKRTRQPRRYHQQLMTGHRGCGKTTEFYCRHY